MPTYQRLAPLPAPRSLAGVWVAALLSGWIAACLAAPVAAQIYKVTDEEQGVIFTDRPGNVGSTSGRNVEEVELSDTNTVAPVTPTRPRSTSTAKAEPEESEAPTVSITSPGNESTIAMGPGNFAVSALAKPPLARGESLVLLIDGQPVGAAQTSSSWFVEGALRGPHDLVVQRTTSRGTTVAISEPVRIYVLRPSIIGR